MPNETNANLIYDYLVNKYHHFINFSKREFLEYFIEKGINKNTIETYWTKKVRPLLKMIADEPDKYYVSERFRYYLDIKRFLDYFSQSERRFSEYTKIFYKKVLIFELFMPLNNELELRSILDALFYKDGLKRLIMPLSKKLILEHFNDLIDGESNYIDIVSNWFSERFAGYSIGFVSGRFRADSLKSHIEALDLLKKGKNYIIDETTSIVKFIIPFGDIYNDDGSIKLDRFIKEKEDDDEKDVKRLEFLFLELFIKNILEVINEEEVWVLESGYKNRLYIYRRK